jgi:hypothetical protein
MLLSSTRCIANSEYQCYKDDTKVPKAPCLIARTECTRQFPHSGIKVQTEFLSVDGIVEDAIIRNWSNQQWANAHHTWQVIGDSIREPTGRTFPIMCVCHHVRKGKIRPTRHCHFQYRRNFPGHIWFLADVADRNLSFTERNYQFNRYIGQQITFFHIPGETYSACSSLGLLNWKKLTVAEEDRNLVNTRKTQLDVKFQSCTCFFCICRNSQIICPYTFHWICVHVALISQEKYLA